MKDQRQYLILKRKWYKKLEESGFKDIEPWGRDTLTKWDSQWFKVQYGPDSFKEHERYYQLASHLLHDVKFLRSSDKPIWKLHSEGMEVDEIVSRLSSTKNHVNKVIKYYSKFIRR